eukprot:scaffold4141_cov117-Skeletonema_dohrnii-CCMP3373.AAC.6
MSSTLHHHPVKLTPPRVLLLPSSDGDPICREKPSKRSCSESYALFKRCLTRSISTKTISCSDVISSYMHCAMEEC